MIFVTVGTTMPFDELIRSIDQLVQDKIINEKVICQIGNGSAIPGHCEWFRFRPEIDALIDSATIVVAHGGTGTVLDLLCRGKPFIAMANPAGAHDHQAQFLRRLADVVPIVWSSEVERLADLLRNANMGDNHLESRLPSLALDVKRFIQEVTNRRRR